MKIDSTHQAAINDQVHNQEEGARITEQEAMLKAAALRLERMNPKSGYHVVQMDTDREMQQTFNTFYGDIPQEGGQWLNRVAVQVC